METYTVNHQFQSIERKLIDRFLGTRKKTEELCYPLTSEDYLLSVTEDTSPPKWHLAHTSWFFENFLLKSYMPDFNHYRTDFDFIFNSYYRRLGSYLPKNKRGVLSRPSVEEIYHYREYITRNTRDLMETLSFEKDKKVFKTFELGIQHEEQHQELLLMDIKRCFYENPLRPHYHNQVYTSGEIAENQWPRFPAGLVTIGVSAKSEDFAYDNEKDQHQVWLESFQISSHLVTNDEYLAFIDEGGYENPRYWLSDGWDYKEKENWQHPLYWEKKDQKWWTMTLSGMAPLELSAPVVHVSYYEASAFAKWRGARLPREAEWETAASQEEISGLFLENSVMDPSPANESHQIFSQIHGSVWEWTQDSYQAYPGHRPYSSSLSEYNEKFMCNQFVLRGGSCITPINHYRVTYRNFYYPHMRWQYSGIRLAKDLI